MSNLIAFLLLGLAACCVLPTLANSLFAQTSKNSATTKTLPSSQTPSKKTNFQQVQGTNDGRESTPGRVNLRDADDPKAGGAPSGQRQPRPEAQPLRIEKPSAELWQVLQDWEVESAKVRRLTGSFKRFVYDDTFEIDKRAEGTFAYEAPDKGNYVLTGSEIKKGDTSRKKNDKGDSYKIVADQPERWVCTGKDVIRIEEKAKTYEMVPLPDEQRGQNIIDGPLPFLFGMKANQAIQRYKMELKQQDDSEIWLDVIPRRAQDAVNWKKSRVIIDAKTFLPKAVQMIDPTGNKTTVHTFTKLEVNKRNGFFSGDPFQPNLAGYKKIISPAAGGAAKNTSSANDRNDRELPRTAAVPPTVPAGKKGTTGTIKK